MHQVNGPILPGKVLSDGRNSSSCVLMCAELVFIQSGHLVLQSSWYIIKEITGAAVTRGTHRCKAQQNSPNVRINSGSAAEDLQGSGNEAAWSFATAQPHISHKLISKWLFPSQHFNQWKDEVPQPRMPFSLEAQPFSSL